MATPGSSLRPARAPGADWEDSYFNLDSRYRQLQKKFNDQQEELKRAKVTQRKGASEAARRLSFAASARTPGPHGTGGGRPRVTGLRGSFTEQTTGPQGSRSSPRSPRDHVSPEAGSHTFVGLPGSGRANANDAQASALHMASLLGSDPGAGLPDPAMIWGAEGSVQNYIAANALYHANEELRRKLEESSTVVQALQKELSATRTLCTNAQARVEDLSQQMHQLVRERDVATQKLATARQSISDFERTLQNRMSEEERTRFALESQIAELRSRLVVGADSNELLTRDVRALLTETKEKTSEVVSLRSKLALAESALSSQRNTNENLLLELKNMNTQLVEERKRLLTAAREVQTSSLVRDRVADLEGQVRRLMEERAAVEREHSRLMGDFVRVTEDALRHAREEVRADLDDWRGAAQHWEEVSQLLYKDVSQRTEAHIRCRAECDEAKAQRDMVAVELRAAKEELAVCRAKLDVVWPTHGRDAEGLTADEVLETFRRRRTTFAVDAETREGLHPTADSGSGPDEKGEDSSCVPGRRGSGTSAAVSYAEALSALPVDQTTSAERIYELQEANAALVAELEQLRLTNEMLQDRIRSVKDRHAREAEDLRNATKDVEKREKAGQRIVEQQLDRVQFLEAQVRSLRGYQVSPSTAMQDVAPCENVLELFLGQVVGGEVPAQMDVPETFSQLFCSADFLLHETITTPTITGLNGFFDTTISFRISMDALLLYYLQTRKLLVQLHRVRNAEEAEAAVAASDMGDGSHAMSGSGDGNTSITMTERLFETVAEGEVSLLDLVASPECLEAPRPTLKGHVRLVTASGRHLASLEFQLTARSPFTEEFKQIVRDAALIARDTPAITTHATQAEGQPRGDAPRPTRIRGRKRQHGREDSPDPSDPPSVHAQSATSDMREWLRRSSSSPSTSSSSSFARKAGRMERTRRDKEAHPESSAQNRTPTGMQLVSAPPARWPSVVAGASAGTGTSSLDSSSLSAVFAPDARRVGSNDLVQIRLHDKRSPSHGSAGGQSPPHPGRPSAGSGGGSFAHIARSLLQGRDPYSRSSGTGPNPNMQSPPPLPAPHSTVDGAINSRGASTRQAIHSVAVDVVRLELPADLPTPIPRLSCYYALSAVGKEVRLAAPRTPQYTIEYAQPDPEFGTVCPVASLTQLAALAREPVTFFFIDEDAPRGSPAVWALALCEWADALASPEVPQSFSLPLLQQVTGPNGRVERRLVRGGILRVRLVASTEASPSREAGPLLAQDVTALAPAHSFLPVPEMPVSGGPSQRNLRTPDAQDRRATNPSVGLSPSPLSALQRLMQQIKEREEEETHASSHAASPAAAAVFNAPPPLPQRTQSQPAPLSMSEQLMQLDLEQTRTRR